jgi:putative ABC transport system permease protein
MMLNYLKFAWRNLLKRKGYSFINIFGLAVGLACAIVLVLYVIGELSYDTHLPDSNRIYRVISHWKNPTSEGWSSRAPAPLGKKLMQERPEVEMTARFVPPYENDDHVLIVRNDDRYFEKKVFFTDPEIVDFFPIRFLKGNAINALKKPNTVAITRKMSKKYFGDADPIGKILQMEFDYDIGSANVRLEAFEVAGVMEDPPVNSHFQYHMLVSSANIVKNRADFENDWLNPHFKFCYIKLRQGADPKTIEEYLQTFIPFENDLYLKRFGRSINRQSTYYLQPIGDIHMEEIKLDEREPKGNWLYVKIYAIIAGLVLLIGCLNFINLSTALFTTRIKELGLKKVIGAGRMQLVRQFLIESSLVTTVAFGLALGIAALFLPTFNAMTQSHLTLTQLVHPLVLPVLLLLLVVVGTVSGLYPALLSTSINPIRILQGRFSLGPRGNTVHNILVIGQFSISIFLMVTTLFAFKQLSFMKGRSLGFEREQKLVLTVNSSLRHLQNDFAAVANAFCQDTSISGATVSSSVPGDTFNGGYHLWREGEERRTGKFIKVIAVSPGFLELFGIGMAHGRSFEKNRAADLENAFILNAQAARELGFQTPQEAVGKKFTAHYHERTKTIIGVTQDFHVRGMQEKIIPLVLDIEGSLMKKITISFRAGQVDRAMRFVKGKWSEHFPNVPMEYHFLDESFGAVYRYEEQMSGMLSVITILAMIVACLGLSGLAAFVTWKRRKEIGIRKVLGAHSRHIVHMFSWRFLSLVGVALVLSIPFSWLAVKRWLDGFAYRIEPTVWPFFGVALAILLLAFFSVFIQTIRALRLNLAQTLKEE